MLKAKVVPLKPFKDKLQVLDQLLLPHQSIWVVCGNEQEVFDAIKKMQVRGAPAIGITAAYGYYLAVRSKVLQNKKISTTFLETLKQKLDSARPTAVNLMWATQQMFDFCSFHIDSLNSKKKTAFIEEVYKQAIAIHKDDERRCLEMSRIGYEYITKKYPKKKYNILTHCNTGSLATGGIGTALGLIRYFHSFDKINCVYVDETRPYLQGARLTAYELQKEKIPLKLQADSQAAYLMKKGLIDFVVVGADRIAQNGDFANKVGTYSLAVLAHFHKIPFFVLAPKSTFDTKMKSGDSIVIEERHPDELLKVQGIQVAAKVEVLNYSFDVTDGHLVEQIFSEEGEFFRR